MNIVLFGTQGVTDEVRLINPIEYLEKEGHKVDFGYYIQWEESDLDKYDLFFMSRPPMEALPIIEKIKKNGNRLIIDVDDDFYSIPFEHPAYKSIGPGNKKFLDTFTTMLGMADLLTVASSYMADRYIEYNPNIYLLPNGYDNSNPFWEYRYKIDDKFNFGWSGTITHQLDFKIILPALEEFTNNNKNTRILIGGDPDIYNMLNKIPEKQKMYLPPVPYSHYPLILARFDAMIVPLIDNEFNRHKSDIKMVDAGAMSIPWLASPLPQYREWNKGGYLCCDDPQSWLNAMNAVTVNDTRNMAKQGNRKAKKERTMNALMKHWRNILK